MLDSVLSSIKFDPVSRKYLLKGSSFTEKQLFNKVSFMLDESLLAQFGRRLKDMRLAAFSDTKPETGMDVIKFDTIRDSVEYFFEIHNCSILATGETKNASASSLSVEDEYKAFMCEMNAQRKRIPEDLREGIEIPIQGSECVLRTYIAQKAAERRDTIKNRIRYSSSYRDKGVRELKKLLQVLLPDVSPRSERYKTDYLMFRHALLQCKQKLFGYPVLEHLMLFLYGHQGTGKSTLFRLLAQPLQELYSEVKAQDLIDNFNAQLLSTRYLLNIEEFKLEKEVEWLKQLITTVDFSQRKMFSGISSSTPQNCTFMATSNRPLPHLIRDYTGMRRFWEIDITSAGRQLDWNVINSIDFLAIWKSIDETSVTPWMLMPKFKRFAAYARARQEDWRAKNRIEKYLTDTRRVPLTPEQRENENFVDIRSLQADLLKYGISIGAQKDYKIGLPEIKSLLRDVKGLNLRYLDGTEKIVGCYLLTEKLDDEVLEEAYAMQGGELI